MRTPRARRLAEESAELRSAANDRTAIEYPLRVRIAELEREVAAQRRRADRAEFQYLAYRQASEGLLALLANLDTDKGP